MARIAGEEAIRYLREHSDAILVVDGSPISRRNLRRNLEYYGFKVAEAADAAQALERYGERPPIGLVLLDVTTIGAEARTLVARLMDADPHVRILLCTSQAPSEIRPTGRPTGIVGLLRKPVRTDRLLNAVSKALGA
ncbi:MAG: response regulator [Candidatus Latescibacterota bacterium]